MSKTIFLLLLLTLTSCSKSEVQKKIEQHESASKALFNEKDVSQHKEAFDYLYSEYQNGSAYSAGKVGWAYQKGLGVKQDLEMAIKLYEFAAGKGMAYWQYLLAHAYEQGYLGFEVDQVKKEYWLNQKNKVHSGIYECWVVTYYEMGIYPKNQKIQKRYEALCERS